MEKFNSLVPTIVLIVSTIINHVYKENKELTTRDLMLMLSPTIPTVMPILISMLTDLINNILNKTYEIISQKENMKEFMGLMKGWFTYLFPETTKSHLSKFKVFNNNEQVIEKSEAFLEKRIIHHPKKQEISISFPIQFMQALINYITKSKDCEYEFNKENVFMQISNENDINETRNFKNIVIKYQQLNIMTNDLRLTYKKINNDYSIASYQIYENTEVEKKLPPSSLKRFSDLIKNDKLRNLVRTLCDAYIARFTVAYYKEQNTGDLFEKKFERQFQKLFSYVCPDIMPIQFTCDFLILEKIVSRFCMKMYNDENFLQNIIINKKKQGSGYLVFDCFLPSTIDLNSQKSDLLEFEVTHSIEDYQKCRGKFVFSSDSFQEITEFISPTNYPNQSAKISTKQNITFSIIPEDENLTNEEINNKFMNLIDEIYKYKQPITDGKKIRIFNTKIERKENVTKTQNPEYIEYQEKKEILTKLMKDPAQKENNDIFSLKINEFILSDPPPKELTEKSIESVVSIKQVNEKFKSFDTLYLRELDVKRLHNILIKFKNGAKLFEDYGLPNKLGVLLYGLPGTGKTTTIHAIASYLQKNIYYVNLSDVQTNEELQMIFDHVLVQSSSSGIIVFEDIDAMTNVVLDRSKYPPNNEKLTLEYFLNLLQGSLTRDGTIFIATTNHIEKLDPAFCRIGRFDVRIDMKLCDRYQIKKIYKTFVGNDIDDNVLEKIEEDKYSPAEIIFHLVNHIDSYQSSEQIMKEFI